MAEKVQLPSIAVSESGDAASDVLKPTQDLLIGLSLLGTDSESKQASGLRAVVGGPPQSVALIEAGATAVAKWWAAGAGAAIVGTWTTALAWFGSQDSPVQVAVLVVAGVVSAALIIAIGHLLASDVRGRGLAAAATIEARSNVALAMLDVAEDLYRRPAAPLQSQLIPVAPAREIVIRDTGESGWSAVAMKHDAEESVKFLVIKGSERRFLDVTELIFVNQTPPLAPAGGNGTAAWRFRLLS